jgi:hypothetical protein
MKAAFLFQGVSLFTGIISLPVFLHYMSADAFFTWILFTTIGGLTIQLEYALQIISVRQLSRSWYAQGPTSDQFNTVIYSTRKRFLFLSAMVIFVVGPGGFYYFSALSGHKVSPGWPVAWGIFILAYGVNYFFSRNNCILLATDNTQTFNYINAFSRSLNFVLTTSLLAAGFSIIGVAFSFLASVGVGVTLIRKQAEQILAKTDRQRTHKRPAKRHDAIGSKSQKLLPYTAFSFMAFFLYRGAFILISYLRPGDDLAPYGLILQIAAIVYAIAIIPTQVRLKPLVEYVLAKSQKQILREIYFHLGFVALVFLVSGGIITLVGPILLQLNRSQSNLPPTDGIVAVFIAFALEAVIFTLVNLLVVMRSYRFTIQYLALAFVALTLGVAMLLSGGGLYTSMILMPFAVQLGATLPLVLAQMIFRLRQLGTAPALPV